MMLFIHSYEHDFPQSGVLPNAGAGKGTETEINKFEECFAIP